MLCELAPDAAFFEALATRFGVDRERIVLNPADPPMIMRDTIFCAVPADSDLADALASLAFADERLAAFDASIRAMSGLLAVDRVLQVIVDRVRELVGARYAALGIADGRGRIERFITSGISPEGRAALRILSKWRPLGWAASTPLANSRISGVER